MAANHACMYVTIIVCQKVKKFTLRNFQINTSGVDKSLSKTFIFMSLY